MKYWLSKTPDLPVDLLPTFPYCFKSKENFQSLPKGVTEAQKTQRRK
jgi:hypothetical protein